MKYNIVYRLDNTYEKTKYILFQNRKGFMIRHFIFFISWDWTYSLEQPVLPFQMHLTRMPHIPFNFTLLLCTSSSSFKWGMEHPGLCKCLSPAVDLWQCIKKKDIWWYINTQCSAIQHFPFQIIVASSLHLIFSISYHETEQTDTRKQPRGLMPQIRYCTLEQSFPFAYNIKQNQNDFYHILNTNLIHCIINNLCANSATQRWHHWHIQLL